MPRCEARSCGDARWTTRRKDRRVSLRAREVGRARPQLDAYRLAAIGLQSASPRVSIRRAATDLVHGRVWIPGRSVRLDMHRSMGEDASREVDESRRQLFVVASVETAALDLHREVVHVAEDLAVAILRILAGEKYR